MFAGCFGCCNGLVYTIPLKICWDYFPERKGMVSGTIICGFGLGSFIFSFVSTLLTNPNNLSANHEVGGLIYYDQEVASRVPAMIYKFAASWILLFSVSFCCLKPVQLSQSETEESCDEDIQLKELVKDKRFWHMYIMNFSSVFYGYLLIGSYKTFGSKYIDDDMYLTLVGSVGCIFGSLRFFWSMLLDFDYTYPQVYGVLVLL
jgi:MFS transporter, OFA family, oxalate/formate antiporter